MRNLLILLLMFMSMSTMMVAQKTMSSNEVSKEDYQRYIDKTLQIDYRNYVLETVGLTAEEIEEFDKVFFPYVSKQEKLQMKKADLLADYQEEMKENDSAKNQDEDRADFIEDYWETLIAGMDLKKEYFDDLEDEIPVIKAVRFFMLDDAVNLRVDNNTLATLIPTVNDIDRSYSMKKAVKTAGADMANTKMMSNNTDASDEDYQQYIDSKLEMQFRNAAFEALNLTKDEIIAIDPIFNAYMSKQERLIEKRDELLEDIKEEMKEDDDTKNQLEDYADFFEDRWENEIASMELKKDYFDRMEDKIGTDKAIQFFLFENAVENRMAMNIYTAMLPNFIVVDQIRPLASNKKRKIVKKDNVKSDKDMRVVRKSMFSSSTTNMIQSFEQWVLNNRGEVSLSHDYTSNGIKSLVNTLEAVKNDLGIAIPDFDSKRTMILQKAEQMTVNWKSHDHADQTRAAFIALGEIMNKINNSKELWNIAQNIDKDVLMTKQASTIYRFFETASQNLQSLQNNFNASRNTQNIDNRSKRK